MTNRDFLASILRSRAFLAGDTTTDFIERHAPRRSRPVDDEQMRQAAIAAAMWLQGRNRHRARTLSSLPSGFRIGRLARERITLALDERELTVYYSPRREGGFALGARGDEGHTLVHGWSSDSLDVEVDGRRRAYRVAGEGDHVHLSGPGGGLTLRVVPRFSVPEPEQPGGALAAPMPGKVVDLRVAAGDTVVAGQVVAVLEAMKMENHLRAAESGTVVEVLVTVAQQVEKDALLMVIEPAGSGEERR